MQHFFGSQQMETYRKTSGMSFGETIEAMKMGRRVNRKTYSDEGIRLIKPGVVDCEGNQWMASSNDMLADDWYIVE